MVKTLERGTWGSGDSKPKYKIRGTLRTHTPICSWRELTQRCGCECPGRASTAEGGLLARMVPMIPRGAFRIGVRVRGNSSAISTSRQHQHNSHHHNHHQRQQTRGVKKMAAVIMGAPGRSNLQSQGQRDKPFIGPGYPRFLCLSACCVDSLVSLK